MDNRDRMKRDHCLINQIMEVTRDGTKSQDGSGT